MNTITESSLLNSYHNITSKGWRWLAWDFQKDYEALYSIVSHSIHIVNSGFSIDHDTKIAVSPSPISNVLNSSATCILPFSESHHILSLVTSQFININ